MSRSMTFLIFFSIILLIYGSANYYVFIRGYQALSGFPSVKPWYIAFFTFVSLSYIAARVIERYFLCTFTDILTWIGSFWMAALLYFFIAVLLIDILRLLIWILPGISIQSLKSIPNIKPGLLLTVISIVTVIIVVGFYNATRPKVVRLQVNVPARSAEPKHITLALASDIHLGTLVANNRLGRLIGHINRQKPDIILLAGDIVDEDLAPVIRQNLGQALEQLKAPLGVWAITGNHEYIGGAEQAIQYLQQHGIIFLRDTAVKIDGHFWLAGREDKDMARFSGKKRKELEEVMSLTDSTLPVILMDHQPFNLNKVAEAGVSLQLSGHTHHGQLWPLNYLTDAIYEVSYGYLKKANTHFYVSSGYGTWGPPVRLGSRSEIMIIDLNLVK